VVHSGDHGGVDVAHKITKNQPQFSQTTIGLYCEGKAKAEQALRLTQSAFKK